MKIYYNSAAGEVAPVVVDGDPPSDQSALIAQLQAENAQFRAFRDAVVADANARKAADAANVEGQSVIDAAASLPA
jgi:hypothetical protein